MKNFFILTSAAAFAAFLTLPVNAEIAGSVSFIASLAMVLTADYGRTYRALSVRVGSRAKRESLRLAA